MKRDGVYRFSLQFPAKSNEQICVGELLEKLGNRKSRVIVAALQEYITRHPELISSTEPPQIVVTQGFDPSSLEEFVKEVLEKYLISSVPYVNKEIPQIADSQAPDSEIDQMLGNLDMFL